MVTDAVTPNPSLTAFKPDSIKPSYENSEEMAHEIALTRQTKVQSLRLAVRCSG